MRAGAAALAARAGVALLPVHINGTAPLMGPGRAWMVRPDGPEAARRHSVAVTFGTPLTPRPGDDLPAVMAQVRSFMQASSGEPAPGATPDRTPAAIG